jgi:Arc/MetJ family transcription regulator
MGRVAAQRRKTAIKRTTVDVDMTQLAEAKKVLGTRTTRDTIDTALRQVNRKALLARSAALIAAGKLDVVSPEELAALRQVEA